MKIIYWIFKCIVSFLLLSAAVYADHIVIVGGDVTCGDESPCSGENILLNSTDGITWSLTKPDLLQQTEFYDALLFANNKFYLTGECAIYNSTDGNNWQQLSASYSCFSRLFNFNNTFFAFDNYFLHDNSLFTSQDGLNFQSILEYPTNFSGLTYAKNKYVLVGGSAIYSAKYRGEIFIKPKKANLFKKAYAHFFPELNDVIFADNLFIGIGKKIIVISQNGETWSELKYQHFDTTLKSISYGANGVFVTVGDAGTILFSHDGYYWHTAQSGTNEQLNKIIWISRLKIFIIVGSKGIILTSNDGEKWSRVKSNTTHNLKSVATD